MIVSKPELWRDEIVKMQTMKKPIVLFGAGNTREFNLEYFRALRFCRQSIDT